MLTMDENVQVLDKVHGSDIFMAAKLVGNPFASLPAVIQVQHRSDGVHSETIYMVGIQPKQGAVQEKVANFGAVIIEDPAVPVRMVAESGICMVVEVCAIKLTETMRIIGKMRR